MYFLKLNQRLLHQIPDSQLFAINHIPFLVLLKVQFYYY